MAAEILSSHGITPLVIAEAAPTPAISYAVIREKADGAINFTASHNPPEYNGIKFSTPDGAPALPEVTKQIEAEIAAGERRQCGRQVQSYRAGARSASRRISRDCAKIVDLKAIQKAGLRVVFDPFGARRAAIPIHCLREAGVEVATVHDYRDVLFGGHAPEPDDHLLEADAREDARAQKPTSASPPTATPTASASSMKTARSFSRITSSRCCSTTWWKAAAGRMAWASRSPPPT